ncbi:MAG: hypothetical protein KIT37_07180 [Steroidobacteraceae bacterium]|nr:hypothetical protein [Steroidobacteraceae bacterium]
MEATPRASLKAATLFTPMQAFAATLLGGPAAGAVTLWVNFKTAGLRRQAAVTVLVGIVATFLVAIVALKFSTRLSRHTDPRIIPLAYSAIALAYARSTYGKLKVPDQATRSWWWLVPVVLLGLCVLLVAMALVNSIAPGGDSG